MIQLPQSLVNYICSHVADQHFPAYLRIHNDIVLELGGQLERYGFQTLQLGDNICGKLDFLEGVLPSIGDPIFLPLIKYQQDCSMDIHIFPAQEGDWVLLLDANTPEEQQLELQQQGNYLALKAQHQRQQLSGLFQTSDSNVPNHASRQPVATSVLSIKLTPRMESASIEASQILHEIETYFASVTTQIVEGSGIVAAQMGYTLSAIFGLQPSKHPPAELALETGLNILAKPLRTDSSQDLKLEAGAMIQSGESILGVLRASPYQSIGLISLQMSEVMALTGYIRPQELRIDAQTFHQLSHHQQTFTRADLSLEKHTVMTMYSCPSGL